MNDLNKAIGDISNIRRQVARSTEFRGYGPATLAATGLFALAAAAAQAFWLADPASNTFGGVYTWQDRAAYEAYTRSELSGWVSCHPNLSNVASQGFDILEEPTRQTRGLPAQRFAA